MKWLILFKGGIETQEFFSVELAQEWEKQGFGIYWYDLMLEEESARMLGDFYEAHKEESISAFTFNFNGIAGEEGLYKGGWNFWDYSGIRVVNMVVDHPLYYHRYLAIHPKNYIQICIDKVHVKYMERFFSDVELCDISDYGLKGFVPLGGTKLNKDNSIIRDMDYMPVSERTIDIIFTGNYTPKEILRRNAGNMEQEYIDFYQSIIERIIDSPDETLDYASEMMLRKQFGNISDEEIKMCMPNMMYVDLNVRFHYRALAVAALADAGFKVHICGEGFNYIKCTHPENIISMGGGNSLKCLEFISQSKISLNVMPWFKEGAHDRIFNSMLNGAVVLSDTSEYLEEEFEDGKDLIFYDLKELREYEKGNIAVNELNMVKRVQKLLSDDSLIKEISDNAYARCISAHTWKNRADKIAALFDK